MKRDTTHEMSWITIGVPARLAGTMRIDIDIDEAVADPDESAGRA